MVEATRAARSGPAGAGLALAVLSAATFGTSGTFASALIRAGWSPAAAVIIRIAMSALILTVPALLQLHGRWGLLRRAAPRVAVYGLLAVAGCQLFYFNALQRIPVGVALLLEYLGAVLVVLWAWLRHGQRPRRLITNAAKHARASVVAVDVEASGDTLQLRVRDDGIGGADPLRGSGLTELKDRIEALGGIFSLHSPEGGGTVVSCELPVPADGGQSGTGHGR